MPRSLSPEWPANGASKRAAGASGAYACVDPGAIAHNLQAIRRILEVGSDPGQSLIWAVVKANAYGHGLEHVLPALYAADGLAVACAADAYRCRRLGWTKPLLALCGHLADHEINDPALYPLHVVVDHADQLDQLERLTGGVAPQVWLRFTGRLHHAGFQAAHYRQAYNRLQALLATGRVSGIGHFQHYASAEDTAELALERLAFQQLTAGLPGQICTENSAALLVDSIAAASTDWVRAGIALYGASPLSGHCGTDLGFRPAMALHAPIYGVQHLSSGDGLGYNSAFRADRTLRIGLVRCGYADGYPRSAPSGCPVLAGGGRTRILGRVSMDTLTIDLSGLPHVATGDIVTLWGAAELPVEELARATGTIAAQLLTGLTERVPRRLVGAA